MNTRRGLNRLVVVVTVGWYVFGGLWAFGEWEQHWHDAKGLTDCTAARVAAGANEHLARFDCIGVWGAANSGNAWAVIFIVLLTPVLIYVASRPIMWIIRGFRDH